MIERLILARHGETLHNIDGIAQGWSDSELSERGHLQVRQLAERAVELGATTIYSSPLPRALATAEAIASCVDLELKQLDDLREMHCGRWEGRRFLEIRADEPEAYRQWAEDPTVACPGGESFQDVLERMRRALETMEKRENGSRAVPIVVSHGTAIRIAATELLGLPLTTARLLMQQNAAINIFERRNGRFLLRCWNDATHCREESQS